VVREQTEKLSVLEDQLESVHLDQSDLWALIDGTSLAVSLRKRLAMAKKMRNETSFGSDKSHRRSLGSAGVSSGSVSGSIAGSGLGSTVATSVATATATRSSSGSRVRSGSRSRGQLLMRFVVSSFIHS